MTDDVTTTITPDRFRAALGRFATGVAVLTTAVDGEPHGMTVNAVSSVSLDPPLVLVCIDRNAAVAGALGRIATFGLSFLSVDQQAIAQWFADADRPSGADQFRGIATIADASDAPIIGGVLGWLHCHMWAQYDGGDHVIVVGEVDAVGSVAADERRAPLVFFQGNYGTFVDAD